MIQLPLSVRLTKAINELQISYGSGFYMVEELQPFLEVLVEAIGALEYTQRTDVNIGVSEGARDKDGDVDNIMRGMPDKIMMRNRCREALSKLQTLLDAKEG